VHVMEVFASWKYSYNKNEISHQELVQFMFPMVVLHMVGLNGRKFSRSTVVP
jgi:hypothetical protein